MATTFCRTRFGMSQPDSGWSTRRANTRTLVSCAHDFKADTQLMCESSSAFVVECPFGPLDHAEHLRAQANPHGQLRLCQPSHDAQINQGSFAKRYPDEFFDRQPERGGDPGDGIRLRRSVARLPVVDSAWPDP